MRTDNSQAFVAQQFCEHRVIDQSLFAVSMQKHDGSIGERFGWF
jgi:hypothetical protein